jgi:PKD repeat protein
LKADSDICWRQGKDGVYNTAKNYDRFGYVLATGDLNLDGYCDLAVGSPLDDEWKGLTNVGMVHIMFGSTDIKRWSDIWKDYQWSVSSNRAEQKDMFGWALAIWAPENTPPVINMITGPTTTTEGTSVDFSGSFTDPDIADTHTISWDFGDKSGTTGTLNPSHTYSDNGAYTVVLTVEDNDGGSANESLVVTVNNVAPSVDAGPDQTTNEGDVVSFSGSFTDPGADTHTASIDWGDGTSSIGTVNQDTGSVTANHVYSVYGIYILSLKVIDDDGGYGVDTAEITVYAGPLDPAILMITQEQAQKTIDWVITHLSAGTYTQEIKNSLQHAEQSMTHAQNLELKNTRVAAQQYLQAMKHARNALRKVVKENPQIELFNLNETILVARQELVLKFQERFRNHIMEMYQNVYEMMANMSPHDYYKAQNALLKAERKMLHIQEKINMGADSETVDELENAIDTQNEEHGFRDDSGTAQMWRTINKIETKIGRIQEKASQKAATQVRETETTLSQLKGNKKKTENKGKGNK